VTKWHEVANNNDNATQLCVSDLNMILSRSLPLGEVVIP